MVPMTSAILVLGGVFLLALFVWVHTRRKILQSGVPDGRIVSQDTDRRRDLERPLVSSRYGLVGKPDYLVETANGLIPVEFKSRDCARSGPYASDTVQLTTYCVLVEGRDRLTESFSTLIAPGPYATPRKTVSEF